MIYVHEVTLRVPASPASLSTCSASPPLEQEEQALLHLSATQYEGVKEGLFEQ